MNIFTIFAPLWGISSVGRALAWHARGQGSESPILHNNPKYMSLFGKIAVSAAFLFCTVGGYAQHYSHYYSYNQSKGYAYGSVYLSPDEPGGEVVPAQGAVVTIATEKKDTLHAVVGEKGTFRITNVPIGRAYVNFSLLGYEEEGNWVTISPGSNKMEAYLKPASIQIEGAIVKETVPPLKIVKDTLVFNAAAVKVNKGEKAIDILEQMPGVEVTENGVSVLNEAVQNVYVDGTLLFGDSPMSALNNLSAEEVLTIKSYQEYANKDPHHKISKNESKQRVLDVSTKSHPKMVVTGDFIAGGGFDTDSTYHKFRYTLGGTARMNSEKLQLGASFNINNINNSNNIRRSNSFRSIGGGGGSADLRAISASVDVNKKWMSPTVRNYVLGNINGGYSFSNNYNVNESSSQKIYFPSQQFTKREVLTQSKSDNTTQRHNFSLGGSKALADGSIRASASYSLSNTGSNSYSSNYNYQDELAKQGTTNKTHSDNTSHSGSFNFSANKGFNDKYRLSFSTSFSMSKNEALSAKEDSTTTTVTYKVLDINSGGDSRNFNIGPSFRYEISDNSSLGVSYSYSNNYSESLSMAMDVTNPNAPVIDTVNTRNVITSNNTHSVRSNFYTHFDAIDANLSAHAGFNSVGLNKDDRFPVDDPYDRRFNSVSGGISLNTESMLNHWYISYDTNSSTPSLDQVRPKINNDNLYSVSAGNPKLAQSRSHNVSMNYSTVLGRETRELIRQQENESIDDEEKFMRQMSQQSTGTLSTISFGASFSTRHNPIVSRQMYYTVETYLPEYDYTMPAQSTFSTYENVSDSYSADGNISYSTPLTHIQCILTASLRASWSKNPSYVNYTLTNTENFNPSANVTLRSNFSRNIRINLGGNAAYTHSYNDQKNSTDYWTERINVGFEFNNIFKMAYVGGNYFKNFTQGLEYGQMNDNIMNLNAGLRWGPQNNFDFSVAVHDLFNTTTGFSTSMNSNYITNSWRHSFGRYVFFTLVYRFNTMRGSRSSGGERGGWFGGPGQGMGGGRMGGGPGQGMGGGQGGPASGGRMGGGSGSGMGGGSGMGRPRG